MITLVVLEVTCISRLSVNVTHAVTKPLRLPFPINVCISKGLEMQSTETDAYIFIGKQQRFQEELFKKEQKDLALTDLFHVSFW